MYLDYTDTFPTEYRFFLDVFREEGEVAITIVMNNALNTLKKVSSKEEYEAINEQIIAAHRALHTMSLIRPSYINNHTKKVAKEVWELLNELHRKYIVISEGYDE